MRGVIIAGGSFEQPAFYKSLIRETDLIVCADSGYRHACAMGIMPHCVIGDFDSYDLSAVVEGIKVRVLPVEKDKTDLHECILYVIEQGVSEILLFGARGTRLDHSLAAISLLYMGLTRGVTIKMIDERNELFMFKDRVEIPRREGYRLSLLPVTRVTDIHTEGLYYPLCGQGMDWGDPYGVSNEFIEDIARVTIGSGTMMVMLSKD
ncbi:MAG: thiamine diphosphokinase [Ruminococcaceae bacterium]|nr:thiamine diphosphokinase [Oscillospiraceae bacterium]